MTEDHPDNDIETDADRTAGQRQPSRARRIAGITIILSLAVLVILQWPSQYEFDSTLYRQAADGTRSRIAAGETVAVGDCVLLAISTPVILYVYVFSEDARGNARGLFPGTDSDLENPLVPGETYTIPETGHQDTCWSANYAGEFRRLHILTSPEPVPRFRALYLELPQAGFSTVSAQPIIDAATRLDESADIALGVTYKVIDFQPSGT